MACREPFSCVPRSTASDTAVGATATVSGTKPTSPGCQALRYTPDTLRVCAWVVGSVGGGGGKGRSQAGPGFEWQLESATLPKSTKRFFSLMKPHFTETWGVRQYLDKTKAFFSEFSHYLFVPTVLSSLFAVRCGGCAEAVSPAELVMRAGAAVFHLRCFTCSVCSCRLQTGDRCVLREGQLLCAREAYHQCLASPTSSDTGTHWLLMIYVCFEVFKWFVQYCRMRSQI